VSYQALKVGIKQRLAAGEDETIGGTPDDGQQALSVGEAQRLCSEGGVTSRAKVLTVAAV
jgi:hypothetical protein